MTNRVKIMDALQTIQKVCEENACITCPFGFPNDPTKCHIKNTSPCYWELKENNEVWRAFE